MASDRLVIDKDFDIGLKLSSKAYGVPMKTIVLIPILVALVGIAVHVEAENSLSKKQQELLHAIRSGNTELIKTIELSESDLETHDQHGNNLLHLAAMRGDLIMVNVLYERGCPLNVRNTGGHTAAEIAHLYGNWEVESYLIQQEAVERENDLANIREILSDHVMPSYSNLYERMQQLIDSFDRQRAHGRELSHQATPTRTVGSVQSPNDQAPLRVIDLSFFTSGTVLIAYAYALVVLYPIIRDILIGKYSVLAQSNS